MVPPHGYKIGCRTQTITMSLTRPQADELAGRLQVDNPNEEYAVVELVFHHWTKEQE